MISLAKNVLVADDDSRFLNEVADILQRVGCTVTTARNEEDAYDKFLSSLQSAHPIRVVIADAAMPDVKDLAGIRLAKRIKAANPPYYVHVQIVTSNVDARLSEMSWQARADGFLLKSASLTRPEWWSQRMDDVEAALRDKEFAARARVMEQGILAKLVGSSQAMQSLKVEISRLAPSKLTVLIQGETGTGKELIAEAIHGLSSRSSKDLVPIHCGALSESLLEGELFGHKEGGFTGALRDMAGLFEQASGGTVFLDEVDSASDRLQAGLLRVLEGGKIKKVRDTSEIELDLRIVAACNKRLDGCVSAGTFRSDLYYRLNGPHPLEVPPLRDRLADLPELCQHFAILAAQEHGVRLRWFDDSALEYLRQRPWQGNVRELQRYIETIFVRLSEDDERLTANTLKTFEERIRTAASVTSSETRSLELASELAELGSIAEIERIGQLSQQIAADRALRANAEKKSAAARDLGDNSLDGATFRSKVKKWDKDNPHWRDEAAAAMR